MTRVVIVRPWRQGSAAGGCCSADPSSLRAPVPSDSGRNAATHTAHDGVAAVYQLVRTELPAADVQVVNAGNTAYLLPAAYRGARARLGRVPALHAALRATTAGAVLVDGERAGDVETDDPRVILQAVRTRHAESEPPERGPRSATRTPG